MINCNRLSSNLAIPVQGTFYSTASVAPVISGTINVLPNTLYKVKIEVARTDTDDANEKVSSIILNGENFGSCNPNGQACNPPTYYDCKYVNHGDSLTTQTVQSSDEQITIELHYSDEVEMVNVLNDPKYPCTWNNTLVSAVARVTLTPTEGEIN